MKLRAKKLPSCDRTVHRLHGYFQIETLKNSELRCRDHYLASISEQLDWSMTKFEVPRLSCREGEGLGVAHGLSVRFEVAE